MIIEIVDKSIDLALLKGAGQLGVTRDELDFEIINEKKSFLGLFGTKVTVKIWVRKKYSDRKRLTLNSDRNRNKKPKVFKTQKIHEISTEAKDEIISFCEELVSKICHDKVEIKLSFTKDTCNIEANHPTLSNYLSKNTKLAESIEHLIKRLNFLSEENFKYKVFFDSERTRKNRDDKIISTAKELSTKVAKSKKPIVLNYKSAYDRKIVHMTLDNDRRVYTKSVGSGNNRKLMILPSKEKRSER